MPLLAFLIPGDLGLPTGGYIYDRRVLALLPSLGIEAMHVALPGSFPFPTEADLAATAQLVSNLPKNAVLLVDGLAFGAMPARLVRGFRRPLIALCHHPLGLEAGLSPDQKAAFLASETAALALADAVVVTSPATRALLVHDFAVPPQRVTVAVPGTDPAPRAKATGRPPQLLAVGSIVPRKGYEFLLEALAALGDLEWTLTIVGADDRNAATSASVRHLIVAKGLAERVTLVGAVDQAELSDYYAKTDLFVMPSLFEGYGMVLAEAMARGLPIVCTTGGAAAETVPSGAALKVPPGDAAALAKAIRQVLGDTELRTRMAEAAWIAGLALPRWEDTARTLAAVVRQVKS